MKKLFHIMTLFLAAALLLGACNFPSSDATPTVAPIDAINTSAAQTVIALSTQLAVNATATPQNNNPTTAPQDTAVPQQPTSTTQPGGPSATAVVSTPSACDRAQFIRDVSIPDDTHFSPGTAFTKTWRLKNVGTCNWGAGYKLVFDSGDAMGGPASTNLPRNVAAGEEIDLSINLTAPSASKSYIGYWKLENGAGQRFGLGDGNKAFWVKIIVGSTQAPFAVTTANMSVDDATVTASCPYTFPFKIHMQTSAAGRVTYHLERSDGEKNSEREVVFESASTQTITRNFTFDSSFNGWVKVYVDDPNHQFFPQLNVQLTCE